MHEAEETAIDATVPGDIIHVKPSGTTYGNIVMTGANDSISIFGIGFNPDKEISLTSTIGYLYMSGNNVRISGLRFTSQLRIASGATAGP